MNVAAEPNPSRLSALQCHAGLVVASLELAPLQQAGECHISATRAQVWDGLNDPAVLKQCIEGCESMERTGEHQFVATVRAKVGPVSASFKGEVTLADLVPLTSYKLIGSGTGGAAGFARGEARVKLSDAPDGGTLLTYEMDAKVGGKLAQIGSRLVDGAARKMADQFFSGFRAVLEAEPSPAQSANGSHENAGEAHQTGEATARISSSVAAPQPGTQQWIIWTVVFGVLALALILAAW